MHLSIVSHFSRPVPLTDINMQRWWFLEEKDGSANSAASSSSAVKKPKPPKQPGDRRYKFRVLVTYGLLKDETIAVTGSCDALGNWESEHCVQMQPEEGKICWVGLNSFIYSTRS